MEQKIRFRICERLRRKCRKRKVKQSRIRVSQVSRDHREKMCRTAGTTGTAGKLRPGSRQDSQGKTRRDNCQKGSRADRTSLPMQAQAQRNKIKAMMTRKTPRQTPEKITPRLHSAVEQSQNQNRNRNQSQNLEQIQAPTQTLIQRKRRLQMQRSIPRQI